jgi:hypothetical protein
LALIPRALRTTCRFFAALQRQLDNPVSDLGAAHLASLRQLTRLDLGGHRNLTAQGLAFLSGFTALRCL